MKKPFILILILITLTYLEVKDISYKKIVNTIMTEIGVTEMLNQIENLPLD